MFLIDTFLVKKTCTLSIADHSICNQSMFLNLMLLLLLSFHSQGGNFFQHSLHSFFSSYSYEKGRVLSLQGRLPIRLYHILRGKGKGDNIQRRLQHGAAGTRGQDLPF